VNEASEFRDAQEKFEALHTVIVGCSADSVEAQSKFKAKQRLHFLLLADTGFEVIEAYDARRMKTFLGKSFLGIVRMTFWIGPDGRIRKIWGQVTPRGHAAEVYSAVKGDEAGSPPKADTTARS
jgi:thioredoxin-dependent peroxiredoxin